MSIQNFFVNKQNVTNDEIEVSNNNVPSAVVDIVNTVNSGTNVPVAKDCPPNQKVMKNRYDIGHFFN